MSQKEKEIPKESVKSPSTGRTKETPTRPASPAKPSPRPVKAQFKAGKDI